MCDELTEQDLKSFLQRQGTMSRRDFNKLGFAAIMASLLPEVAFADSVTESIVEIPTPEGISDCYFVHPSVNKHPGIILWPDIKGRRPVYQAMAKRLAEMGYSVLVINHYYRDAKAPVVSPEASFGDPDTMNYVRSLASKLTPDAISSDAKAYVSFLDNQPSVDKNRKIGAFGYCMGGADVMRAAAAVPDRVGAIASFHGGTLEISETPSSTHLLIPKSNAQALHAIAENDDQRTPEIKNILKKEYQAANLSAEVEVYKDTLHGWCTPDFSGYHQQQAKQAWTRLIHLFETALS